jgi:hypothetical protein
VNFSADLRPGGGTLLCDEGSRVVSRAELCSLAACSVYSRAHLWAQFAELTAEDAHRLDQHRALITAIVKQRYGTGSLTRSERDLPVLQRLLDDKAFRKSQTYELQSLGVAFGDVLTSEFPLRWVMITDEFGTDPTLRFKQTSTNINALSMISKRVERDENVDLFDLVRKTRGALADADQRSR